MDSSLLVAGASQLAHTWGGPVALGMCIGAVTNIAYALIMLRISETKCEGIESATETPGTATVHESAHLVHASPDLAGMSFEGGVRLKDLVHGDPTVLALHINNHQLQQLITQADALASQERKRLNRLLDLARRELDIAMSPPTEVQLVKAAAIPALLEAAKADTLNERMELASKVPRTKELLSDLLASATPSEGWGPKEAPMKCLQMVCETRKRQSQFSLKRQEAERLRGQAMLLETQRSASGEAKAQGVPNLGTKTVRAFLQGEREATESGGEGLLRPFYAKTLLSPYLPLPDMGEDQLGKDLEAMNNRAGEAEAARDEALRSLEEMENNLNSSCGLWLRRANWTYVHNEELRKYKAVADDAKDKWCIDYVSGDPTHRTRPGLALPRAYWERDPAFWPSSESNSPPKSISFLVFAETNRGAPAKEEVERVVRWILKCVLGEKGNEGVAKVRGEALFMVTGGPAQAAEVDATVQNELEAVQGADRNTERALFDFRSAAIVRPPGSSFAEVVDLLSHIAVGDTMVLLHSEEVPDAECSRLDAAVATLEGRPKLAVLGYHAGEIKLDSAAKASDAPGKQVAAPAAPALGVQFQFVGHVSGFPMIIRREALKAIGGIDSAHVLGSIGPSISSWLLCSRFWLAGYQVGVVPGEMAPLKVKTEEAGTPAGCATPESLETVFPPEAKMKVLVEHYDGVSKAIQSAE